MNLLFLNDSPTTSPYASFPFTMGHEVVGKVIEIGSDVHDIHVGDRIVVDPILSCEARGIKEPCLACARGDYSLCKNMTEGVVSPGLLIGACKDTGGGWSSHFMAHKSQLLVLPDEVDDLNGVMIEPFGCALHAVMRHRPKPDDTILVLGAGVIGLCVIGAIRALGMNNKVAVLAKHPTQIRLAKELGADHVVKLSRSGAYYQELAEVLHAKVLKPIFGPPVIHGGADVVIECVGNTKSVNDALRLTNHGGNVILLGLAGILKDIDWTTVWLNELQVNGSFAYSTEQYHGEQRRTLDIALELMREEKVDLSSLVTHQYPLDQYKNAFATAIKKGKGDAIKIVFEPSLR